MLDWQQTGVILGAIAAWTVVHAYLVVPRILKESRNEWEGYMDRLMKPVHERLDALDKKIDENNERCFKVMSTFGHRRE